MNFISPLGYIYSALRRYKKKSPRNIYFICTFSIFLFITKGEDFIKLGTRSVSGESRILALAMVSSIIYKI